MIYAPFYLCMFPIPKIVTNNHNFLGIIFRLGLLLSKDYYIFVFSHICDLLRETIQKHSTTINGKSKHQNNHLIAKPDPDDFKLEEDSTRGVVAVDAVDKAVRGGEPPKSKLLNKSSAFLF